MKKEAIILAGGFGTRLRHVVSDVPKPMVPVCGHPFLQYILDDLIGKGVGRAVLAVGYRADVIEGFFGRSYNGLSLAYSREETPLFTGGAVKKALHACEQQDVFVVNGDTFFDVDFNALAQFHTQTGAQLTIAAKPMRDFSRYGTLELAADGRIMTFREKRACASGVINGGVYCVSHGALGGFADDAPFSLEQDYLEKRVCDGAFYAFLCDGYFIDIGIPEDYAAAQEAFKNR